MEEAWPLSLATRKAANSGLKSEAAAGPQVWNEYFLYLFQLITMFGRDIYDNHCQQNEL
jgi:hypothetical protein